ncbi:VHS domain-containing protein [Psidium guajava]|nr:VHS domain-containing protein [Psidium guajava]
MDGKRSAELSLSWFWIVEYLPKFEQVKPSLLDVISKVAPEIPAHLGENMEELVSLRRLEELCGRTNGSMNSNLSSLESKAKIDASKSCKNVLQLVFHNVRLPSPMISSRISPAHHPPELSQQEMDQPDRNHYLAIQSWVPNFISEKATINKVAACIRIPQLSLEYFDEDFLRRIGNRIRLPLKADAEHLLRNEVIMPGCVFKLISRSPLFPNCPLLGIDSGLHMKACI